MNYLKIKIFNAKIQKTASYWGNLQVQMFVQNFYDSCHVHFSQFNHQGVVHYFSSLYITFFGRQLFILLILHWFLSLFVFQDHKIIYSVFFVAIHKFLYNLVFSLFIIGFISHSCYLVSTLNHYYPHCLTELCFQEDIHHAIQFVSILTFAT